MFDPHEYADDSLKTTHLIDLDIPFSTSLVPWVICSTSMHPLIFKVKASPSLLPQSLERSIHRQGLLTQVDFSKQRHTQIFVE